MAFSDMFGNMFGGMDFSSLYGDMATQQQQNQQQNLQYQPYSGQQQYQTPPSWNNFSNFGLGSMWGDSGQHPGLGSWGSPSYSPYEAPSSESMQESAAIHTQQMQQQMEQDRQQAEQRYQQGIEQQRYQNQLMEQQPQPQMQQGAGGVPPPPSLPWGAPPGPAARSMPQQAAGGVPPGYAGMFDGYQPQRPQQMGKDRIISMIQGLF
jgi:hypothetical protein